jgi:sterol desaturase/sphingolipid hydroxylase (fatty acid hydroxylase superfamily)
MVEKKYILREYKTDWIASAFYWIVSAILVGLIFLSIYYLMLSLSSVLPKLFDDDLTFREAGMPMIWVLGIYIFGTLFVDVWHSYTIHTGLYENKREVWLEPVK